MRTLAVRKWLVILGGLAIACGAAYFVIVTRRMGIELLALAVVGVVAVGMLAKPVWGLCLAVLLDLYFSYVQTLGLPPRNYVIAFLVIPAAIRLLRGDVAPVPAAAYRLIAPVAMLTFWAFLRGITLANDLEDGAYEFAKVLGVPLLICLVTSSILSKERDVRRFLNWVFACLVLSSIVAVLQFSGVEAAWHIRESLGLEEDSSISHQILIRERASGLTYFAIQLAYQLVTVLPIAASVLLIGKGAPPPRLVSVVTIVTLVAGLGATLARSGIAGALAAVGVVVWLSGRQGRMRWLVVMAVVLVSLVGAVDLAERRGLTFEELSYGRLPLLIAGVLVAINHPLGIGPQGHFNEYSANYYSEVSDLPGAHMVLERAAHNQFLNILVSLGFLGFGLMVWFYIELFRLLRRLRRSPNLSPYLQRVVAGLTGAFVGYLINAFFHNPGPFTGDPFNWYWIGLVLVVARFAERRGEGAQLAVAPVEALGRDRRPEATPV